MVCDQEIQSLSIVQAYIYVDKLRCQRKIEKSHDQVSIGVSKITELEAILNSSDKFSDGFLCVACDKNIANINQNKNKLRLRRALEQSVISIDFLKTKTDKSGGELEKPLFGCLF